MTMTQHKHERSSLVTTEIEPLFITES